MRKSTYKQKILKLFEDHHFLSIAAIHKKIQDANYSTIYRNIEQLVRDKKIRKIAFDKKSSLYERNHKKDNHDHFICLTCEKIETITAPIKELPALQQYKITDFLVRGICKKCQ